MSDSNANGAIERYTDPKVWADYAQTLPQIKRIKPDALQRWAEHLSTLPEDVAAFHAARVRGFGGSEIGVLLTEAQGERDAWSTANWIVRQKLLELLPLPPEPAMLRGKVLEPLAAAAFLRPSGIRVDREALKAIAEPIASGKYAWMAGNADLVVRKTSTRKGVRSDQSYLVEFKNPGELPGKEALIDFRYAAQGLFYAAKAEKQGVRVDTVMVAHYVLQGQDGLAEWLHDPEIMQLFVQKINNSLRRGQEPLIKFQYQEVPRDPAIIRGIHEIGSQYWNDFVLKGQVPELPKPKQQPVSPELAQELALGGREYLVYKKLEARAKDAAATLSERLRTAGVMDPSWAPPHGLTFQRKRAFNADRAEALLKSKGLQPLDYREAVFDMPRLLHAATTAGVDVGAFATPGNFSLEKAARHLRPEEVEDLHSDNPVLVTHGRSSDPRVVGAIKTAEDVAGKMMVDIIAETQVIVKTMVEAEQPDGGSKPRRGNR